MDRDINNAVEALTDSLIDDMYASSMIECNQCKEMFSDDIVYGSSFNDKPCFCSEECVAAWDKANKHDYERKKR